MHVSKLFLLLVCLALVASSAYAGNGTNGVVDIDTSFQRSLTSKANYTIAVLPMENFSPDGEIAFYFRNRLMERLRAKGFSLVKLKLLDKGLHDLGVAHAGQLKLLEFDEVASLVGADAFMSGVVEQAAVQHAGVYNSYVYTCSLKLQDRSGKVIWSALQERVAKRRFAIDPVNALLDSLLVEGGGEKKQAISALADKMLGNMPDGPLNVVVGDSLFDQAVTVEATGGK